MKEKINKNFVKYSIIILTILFILFIAYIFTFVIVRPFKAEITQDRHLIEQLCNMQAACKSTIGPYKCSENPNADTYHRLNRWSNFKGCNNETPGYENDGYIKLESCSCGGLMS